MIDHHNREPNKPIAATLVEGDNYKLELTVASPGSVQITLWINDRACGTLPFDNAMKAAARIDPDASLGLMKQVTDLRNSNAKTLAEMYEWRAAAELATTRVKELEERIAAFEAASKA